MAGGYYNYAFFPPVVVEIQLLVPRGKIAGLVKGSGSEMSCRTAGRRT